MAGKSKGTSSVAVVLLILAAIALYIFEQFPKESPSPATSTAAHTGGSPSKNTGRYETHEGCTLIDFRNNDGDSFRVRLPDGREEEIRLYYVDAPESAFKRYPGGDTNHTRIRQQAADLGGITPEQAVEIGKAAKSFTISLLERRSFTIHTVWDSPFNDRRYHAFIEVEVDGKPRWLHELLIERGLARIKTKPAELPDGTSVSQQREKLRALEKKARQSGAGAWK